MPRIRVVAVDDSAVARKVLKQALGSVDDVELLGVLGTPALAIARCAETPPHVVVLDLFMAESGWDTTLQRLRAAQPLAHVLVIAPDSAEGQRIASEALSAGASDWLARPLDDRQLLAAGDSFSQRLLEKVRVLVGQAVPPQPARATPAPTPAPIPPASVWPRRSPHPQSRIDVLAIGVSTGGPNALGTVLMELPADFPLPIVIVQHMPPVFTQSFAHNLNQGTRIRVREAADGDELRAGLALLAPGDRHVSLERRNDGATTVATNQGAPENFCRPAVDVLFRSVAALYGEHALALILTGMGQDGLLGCRAIAAAGGTILVQDEATSVVWGMPGAVARNGLADEILPLRAIAGDIQRRVRASHGLLARGA